LIVGYDCGGAVHIKFSIKHEAIHVVNMHNLIHGSLVDDEWYVTSKTIHGASMRRYVTEAVVKSYTS
jgi:hypothetical protein